MGGKYESRQHPAASARHGSYDTDMCHFGSQYSNHELINLERGANRVRRGGGK